MQYIDRILEAHRVGNPIRVAPEVFGQLEHATPEHCLSAAPELPADVVAYAIEAGALLSRVPRE